MITLMFTPLEKIKTSQKQRGFSLVELLIALAILSAMITIAAALVMQAPGPSEARADARAMASAMRAVRADAIATRSSVDFKIDLRSHSFVAGDRAGSVRKAFAMKGTGAQSLSEDAAVIGVRFYPNGSSSGGKVDIRTGALVVTVNADWMTGKVSVSEAVDVL